MRRVHPLRGLAVICVSAVLAAAGSVGCGAAAPTRVVVTTQAFRYEPGSFEWKVGQPVSLRLRNADQVEHDFVVNGLMVSVAGDLHAAH